MRAGQAGYEGGFIDHYLLPLIYPAGLTPQIQVGLGMGVVVLNVIIYGWLWRRRRRRRQHDDVRGHHRLGRAQCSRALP